MEKERNTERGIATARQLEKRLSSIALGRIKKPDEAKITEQLKAIELLVKIRGMAEEEKAEPMEVKIRVRRPALNSVFGGAGSINLAFTH